MVGGIVRVADNDGSNDPSAFNCALTKARYPCGHIDIVIRNSMMYIEDADQSVVDPEWTTCGLRLA